MDKDWVGNKNTVFSQLGARNYAKEERQSEDYYATDPSAIDDLLKFEKFNNEIWECACGGGTFE